MKIKMPLEDALFCPKHGRQIWYIGCLGESEKYCDQGTGLNQSGAVIAFVTKKGKIIDGRKTKSISNKVFKTLKPVISGKCFITLSNRKVIPKFEKLLGQVWRYEWNAGIWSGVPNGNLRVSKNGPRKTWNYYVPQFNNEESRRSGKKCWIGRYPTRIKAMKEAIKNWNNLCKECKGRGIE